MAKLYWASDPESTLWCGPHETIEACKVDARDCGEVGAEIWVAPVDAELDDDDAFWDALADHLLVWGVESAEETLVEDGWLDPEEAWKSGDMPKDRDRNNAWPSHRALVEACEGGRVAWE